MTHQEVFKMFGDEIETVMRDYRGKPNGSDAEALAIMRAENARLLDLLGQQKRTLDYMAGEKIEPTTHHADVVLVGVFGGGGP